MITVSKVRRHACLCQKSAATHACMRVVAGLIDTPCMRHEVARKRHEGTMFFHEYFLK